MKHSWLLTPSEARSLQTELASLVDTSSPLPAWNVVAAADVSYNRGDTRLFASVILMEARTFRVLERVGVEAPMAFPYVPGLLSFREAPAVLEAFHRLKTPFDVVLCDGQGIAHPRRLGLASHLGLWLEKPSIGCAKTRFCGQADEPGPNRGDRTPLVDRGDVVGSVVRTKRNTNPLYVSPGHLCDLAGAVSVVLKMGRGYRLPEPSRLAHQYVNEVRRGATGKTPSVD